MSAELQPALAFRLRGLARDAMNPSARGNTEPAFLLPLETRRRRPLRFVSMQRSPYGDLGEHQRPVTLRR